MTSNLFPELAPIEQAYMKQLMEKRCIKFPLTEYQIKFGSVSFPSFMILHKNMPSEIRLNKSVVGTKQILEDLESRGYLIITKNANSEITIELTDEVIFAYLDAYEWGESWFDHDSIKRLKDNKTGKETSNE